MWGHGLLSTLARFLKEAAPEQLNTAALALHVCLLADPSPPWMVTDLAGTADGRVVLALALLGLHREWQAVADATGDAPALEGVVFLVEDLVTAGQLPLVYDRTGVWISTCAVLTPALRSLQLHWAWRGCAGPGTRAPWRSSQSYVVGVAAGPRTRILPARGPAPFIPGCM